MQTNGVDEEAIFHKADVMIESVSPLCETALQADAKAFGMMMKHIREIDPEGDTVIIVQIENEIGILGCGRDYSPLAQAEFNKTDPR